jgi:hypothetical protein
VLSGLCKIYRGASSSSRKNEARWGHDACTHTRALDWAPGDRHALAWRAGAPVRRACASPRDPGLDRPSPLDDARAASPGASSRAATDRLLPEPSFTQGRPRGVRWACASAALALVRQCVGRLRLRHRADRTAGHAADDGKRWRDAPYERPPTRLVRAKTSVGFRRRARLRSASETKAGGAAAYLSRIASLSRARRTSRPRCSPPRGCRPRYAAAP